MTEKKGVNRRDFLKLGGLAAISLPTLNTIGKVGEDTLYESKEEYGGFFIKKHTKDDPPYDVDDSIYQRFPARNTVFGRMTWDDTIRDTMTNVEPMGAPNEPGYRREDIAFAGAAGTVANAFGSNAGMVGKHAGLLGLDTLGGMNMSEMPSTPWDHSHLSDQEVANITKKAAKFYGASLVGITELDERWIYASYAEMMGGPEGDIVFTEVEKVILPEGTVTPDEAKSRVQTALQSMEAEELKSFMIAAMETMDPDAMPATGGPAINPAMMQAMPAKQFQEMMPMMMGSMPTSMIRLFVEKLELDFEIALVDPGESARPRYLEDGSLAIPKTMKWVIVMAFEMDYDCVASYPTTLGMAAASNGYSRMAFTSACLAEFIRNLGYNALPCGNNTGLSVPMAIDAGLGELGRQGILITPKFGPRVRLAKVITDLPMATDSPISFGVKEFCDACMKCAEECPSQAISYDSQSRTPTTISTNPGVMKWAVNAERCMVGWQMSGGDCGNCIRVCPFNKPESWLHDATRALIGVSSGAIDGLMVKMDTAAGFGTHSEADKFWQKDNYIHIKTP